MKVIDCEQGTPEWHKARRGKATGSRIADIMARTKSGPGAMRKNYAAELVAERLTGTTAEHFVSPDMQWGIDNEQAAKDLYAMMYDATLMQVGFVDHPTILMSGASPDSLVGDKGLIEVKCPKIATHIKTLLGEKIDGKYLNQIHWQLACTGRHWCDFVSFDPRLPAEMQLFVKRVERNSSEIVEIETQVKSFLKEVETTTASLRAKYPMPEGLAA